MSKNGALFEDQGDDAVKLGAETESGESVNDFWDEDLSVDLQSELNIGQEDWDIISGRIDDDGNEVPAPITRTFSNE